MQATVTVTEAGAAVVGTPESGGGAQAASVTDDYAY